MKLLAGLTFLCLSILSVFFFFEIGGGGEGGRGGGGGGSFFCLCDTVFLRKLLPEVTERNLAV